MPKRGDIIVAHAVHSPTKDYLYMLVESVAPKGIWNDTPTISVYGLGDLDDIKEVLKTEEPNLLLAVYAPSPSRFRFAERSFPEWLEENGLGKLDVAHCISACYLPGTQAALEHIEVIGQADEVVFQELCRKKNAFLSTSARLETSEEYQRYMAALWPLHEYQQAAVKSFYRSFG